MACMQHTRACNMHRNLDEERVSLMETVAVKLVL